MENPRKSNRKNMIFGIIFLLVMTTAVLAFLLNLNDFSETMRTFSTVRGKDMLLAVLCVILYIALYPVSLCVLCRANKTKTNTLENYLIGASEHFFNGITPYQTGAQPFQIYAFSRRQVAVGEGTGIIIANFFTLLVASNLCVFMSLIFAKDFFTPFAQNGTLIIPILGIVMNFLTLVMILCVITCRWVRTGFHKILRGLCRFKFIGRHLEKSVESFDEYCDNAQKGAREAIAHPGKFVIAVAVKLASLIFYYAIPFFILKAMGVEVGYENFIYCMLATCFAINAVVWIPTPGTSGGIELSFTILFSIFAGFSGAIAAAAAIVWRALTYYILIIISLIEYLLLELYTKFKNTSIRRNN